MAQYFESNGRPENLKTFSGSIENVSFTFTTADGVFAKDGVDFASKLLATNCFMEKNAKYLDLGCGYGFLGIFLAKKFDLTPDFVDISALACELCEMNMEKNGVKGHVYNNDSIPKNGKKYDFITLNPPIHAGKEVIYKLYEDARNTLEDNGQFVIVINKKHGAESHKKHLKTLFKNVENTAKDKQFYILNCTL